MKKLFVFAFAIIALCCGNGCSRTTDSVVDTCDTVDSVDTVNSVDSTSFSMVCPD